MNIGTIIIGRNEGERLQRAFGSVQIESVPNNVSKLLYVDSGSNDGSTDLAQSMNIPVHELDPAMPFSAARARREGAENLIKAYEALEWIQFLDGDCVLEPGWIEKAIEYLDEHTDVGIVCGLLTEEEPERSIYNRMSALRWNAAPKGDIDACGGIFMIRRSVYESVGGFNPSLLTGEESELCSRVRAEGYRIVRLKEKMARHDADLVRFNDWWKRAVWGGYGDALEYNILEGKVSASRQRETRSIFIWTVSVPFIGILGFFGMIWSTWFLALPILCGIGYFALVARIMRDRLGQGDTGCDAALYSALCVLRKFPYAIGFLRYRFKPESYSRRPDPHAAKLSK